MIPLLCIAVVLAAVTWSGWTLAITFTVGHPLSLYHQLIALFLTAVAVFVETGGTYVVWDWRANRRRR